MQPEAPRSRSTPPAPRPRPLGARTGAGAGGERRTEDLCECLASRGLPPWLVSRLEGLRLEELSDEALAELGLGHPLHRRRVLREVAFALQEANEAAKPVETKRQTRFLDAEVVGALREGMEAAKPAKTELKARSSGSEAARALQEAVEAVGPAEPRRRTRFSVNEAARALQEAVEAVGPAEPRRRTRFSVNEVARALQEAVDAAKPDARQQVGRWGTSRFSALTVRAQARRDTALGGSTTPRRAFPSAASRREEAPQIPSSPRSGRGRYRLVGGRVVPVKSEPRRKTTLFTFQRKSFLNRERAVPEYTSEKRESETEESEDESVVAQEDEEEEPPSPRRRTGDGCIEWDRWLEYRLAPAGPMATVEALRSAALAGNPDLLRAAMKEVRAHGERLPRSLDRSPCPEEGLLPRCGGGHWSCSAGPPGLWTWALGRLHQLEVAEEELSSLMEEGRQALERCGNELSNMSHRHVNFATPSMRTNGMREAQTFANPLQHLVRGVLEVRREGPPAQVGAAAHHLFFVSSQELLTGMEQLLQDKVKELELHVGLQSTMMQETDDLLKSLKAAQENLFDRFMEFRAPVERALRHLGAPGAEFGRAELARRLEKAIKMAQREIGARLLLGDAALSEAAGYGLGLGAEAEPENPWSSLTRTPPPWEASFRRALSRLATLRRSSISREDSFRELIDSPEVFVKVRHEEKEGTLQFRTATSATIEEALAPAAQER